MKVFVTGGTGFVGSHLAHKLAWSGHEVALGGLSTDSPIDLPEASEVEEIDVTDPETLDFSGYDAVIHLVGLSPLHKPEVSYHRIHVEGTGNVIEGCKNSGVERLIHMSALGAEPEADTEYLRTKGEAEELVKNSGLDWTIFRPSVIFGDGGEFIDFIDSLTLPFISGIPSANPKFQPIYVEDVGDIIVEAVEDDKHIGKSYNLGGPEIHSLKDISKMIEKSKGVGLKTFPIPMPVIEPVMYLSDRLGLGMGMDQYRSLKKDNIVKENSLGEFRKSKDELQTLPSYLDL